MLLQSWLLLLLLLLLSANVLVGDGVGRMRLGGATRETRVSSRFAVMLLPLRLFLTTAVALTSNFFIVPVHE
jgi:hypothetical protein